MKGIILAGGRGTRLFPITTATNKHFLPIYNKPMIYYPLSVLMLAKIREIILVCNPEDVAGYKKLFSDGSKLGLSINYVVQEKPAGISDGILNAERYAAGDPVCVILGDNLFYGHGLPKILQKAKGEVETSGGAYVFGCFVPDPQRYGVVELDKEGNVVSIQEKPKNPVSNYAVTGLYFFDKSVFEKIRMIKPSFRGELEVTSLNELYLKERKLKVELLGRGFAWFDMGTYYSFIESGEFVYTIEKRTGLMVGCIEEIAFRNGWISRQDILSFAEELKNTDYGKYLSEIIKG